MRRIFLCAILIALWLPLAVGAQPAPILLYWDHDGVDTDRYDVSIDGVRQIVTATCSGSGTSRTCTWPLPTLTPGRHTFIVYPVSLVWGDGPGSDPLVSGPPGKPVGVGVRR